MFQWKIGIWTFLACSVFPLKGSLGCHSTDPGNGGHLAPVVSIAKSTAERVGYCALYAVEFDREEYSQILNDYPELSITLEEGANFLLGVQEMLDIVLSSDFCQEAEYTEVCARFQQCILSWNFLM